MLGRSFGGLDVDVGLGRGRRWLRIVGISYVGLNLDYENSCSRRDGKAGWTELQGKERERNVIMETGMIASLDVW